MPVCHHCGDCPEDSVQHILEVCPAWASQQRDHIAAIGGSDISLPAVVMPTVGSEIAWEGAVSFSEEV